jgi:diguanylate cyclase (GGDEF)-like protein
MVSSPLQALNSNVTFEMYFLAILATSLRYDARICIVVGTIGMAEYGALWAYAGTRYDLHDPRYFTEAGPYAPVDLFTRLILLGISTLLAVTIVRRAQRLLYLAARDRLTGLYNRGHFDRTLAAAMEATTRDRQALSLAILDIDHFKQINDVYGHALGDRALIEVANLLARAMRRTDMVARYGGEEFVILMPGTPRDSALLRLEALRQEVASSPIDLGENRKLIVNFSAGVAGNPCRSHGDLPQGPPLLRRRPPPRRQARRPRPLYRLRRLHRGPPYPRELIHHPPYRPTRSNMKPSRKPHRP